MIKTIRQLKNMIHVTLLKDVETSDFVEAMENSVLSYNTLLLTFRLIHVVHVSLK